MGSSSLLTCNLGLCSTTNAPHFHLQEGVCRCRRWAMQRSRACLVSVPWE